MAVIVVIANGHSHAVVAVASFGQPCLLGYIGEAAALILTVEPVPVAWIAAVKILGRLHRARHVPTVHEEDVEQAVIVVIQKGHAAWHGFYQIFLRSRRVLQSEIQTWRQPELEDRAAGRRCRDDQSRNTDDSRQAAQHPGFLASLYRNTRTETSPRTESGGDSFPVRLQLLHQNWHCSQCSRSC